MGACAGEENNDNSLSEEIESSRVVRDAEAGKGGKKDKSKRRKQKKGKKNTLKKKEGRQEGSIRSHCSQADRCWWRQRVRAHLRRVLRLRRGQAAQEPDRHPDAVRDGGEQDLQDGHS